MREPFPGGGRHLALADVSFAAGVGEAIALVGSSGAGKTTALLAAAGLVKPSGGRVSLDGVDVGEAARKLPTRLRERVGLALQLPERSFFQATVREEIGFTLRRLGRSRGEQEAGIKRAVELLGLDEAILGRSPFSLSGGEKRKVALACAVAHGPSLLLLDEPEAGLDFEGMAAVRSFAGRYVGEGGTLLVSTHDVAWALSWATRFLVLEKGRLVADVRAGGTAAELAKAIGRYLVDDGAWLELCAKAEAAGLAVPSPYRDVGAFLAFLEERLGGRP